MRNTKIHNQVMIGVQSCDKSEAIVFYINEDKITIYTRFDVDEEKFVHEDRLTLKDKDYFNDNLKNFTNLIDELNT